MPTCSAALPLPNLFHSLGCQAFLSGQFLPTIDQNWLTVVLTLFNIRQSNSRPTKYSAEDKKIGHLECGFTCDLEDGQVLLSKQIRTYCEY